MKRLIDNYVRYVSKTDFDLNSRGVRTFEFHSILKIYLLAHGFHYGKNRSFLRLTWPIICFVTCVTAMIIMTLHIYHTYMINDIPSMFESSAYLVIVFVNIIQLISFGVQEKSVENIIRCLDADFEEMDTACERRRKIFFENQLLLRKLTVGWGCFVILVSQSFAFKTVFEIIYQQFFKEYNEHMTRPLTFDMWIPKYNPYASPLYEIFLVIDYFGLLVIAELFGGYISFLIQYILHATGQFNIIIDDFHELYNFSEYAKKGHDMTQDFKEFIVMERLKNIICRHQRTLAFIDLSEQVLGPTLVNQMTLSSVCLCLTGFQVAEGLDHGELYFLFLLLFVGSILQLYIPCSLGSMLQVQAYQAGIACYTSGWENNKISINLAKTMQIFILRSNKDLQFKAIKYICISLETFSSIMSTAGSYFTMLRQINESV